MGYEGVVTANDLIKGQAAPKEKLIRLDLITKEKLEKQNYR